MKKSILMIAIVAIAFFGKSTAQDTTRISPFHLSFITPLGTNGLLSSQTTNLLSFNMIAGYSGGLNGVEFAGFGNALKGDMNRVQFAGFCNNTFGKANGMEVAGFWNFNAKKVSGGQVAGFANIALDTVDGFQASGYFNYAKGASYGQVSGFANISKGNAAGIQSSGFANITIGNMKGVQASGFANVTTGKQTGVQASGFINYAKVLNGVQLGIVNVTDSIEKGIPIGLLCFVKNGYKVLQIGGNETLFGEISFKTGTRRFYNILSAGAGVKNDTISWGFGYGIGTLIPLGKRMDLSVEEVSYQINNAEWFSEHMNMLNRLNLSLSYNITKIITVYAGGSWNVKVTGNEINREHPRHVTSKVTMYPGFNAGLRIGL